MTQSTTVAKVKGRNSSVSLLLASVDMRDITLDTQAHGQQMENSKAKQNYENCRNNRLCGHASDHVRCRDATNVK